jgi:hypothetical protein
METINAVAGDRGVQVTVDGELARVTVLRHALVAVQIGSFVIPNNDGVVVIDIPKVDLAWVQNDGTVWPWDAKAGLFLPHGEIPEYIREQCLYQANDARAKGRVCARFLDN